MDEEKIRDLRTRVNFLRRNEPLMKTDYARGYINGVLTALNAVEMREVLNDPKDVKDEAVASDIPEEGISQLQ